MEAALVFYIIVMFGGLILFILCISGAFSGVEHDISNAPTHEYTEVEFIELYNYCVRKRNALLPKVNGFSSMSIEAHRLRNMDTILNSVWNDYENPYKQPNHTELCRVLLTLLNDTEQKEINYGILLDT